MGMLQNWPILVYLQLGWIQPLHRVCTGGWIDHPCILLFCVAVTSIWKSSCVFSPKSSGWRAELLMHLKEQRGSESLLSDYSVHWVMATVLGHFTDSVIVGRFWVYQRELLEMILPFQSLFPYCNLSQTKEMEAGDHVLCYQQSFSTSTFPFAITNLSWSM